VFDPPSLRRTAPVRVEITDAESGTTLSMTARYIHVWAGRVIQVKVIPQRSGNGTFHKPNIKSSAALHPISDPYNVNEGRGCYTVLSLEARCHRTGLLRKISLPVAAQVFVTVAEPGRDPCQIKVPLAIWPSWMSFLWSSLGVIVVWLILSRFGEVVKTGLLSHAVLATFTDLGFLIEVIISALAGCLLLLFLCWLSVWTGQLIRDAE
jgi:hypothetical protein